MEKGMKVVVISVLPCCVAFKPGFRQGGICLKLLTDIIMCTEREGSSFLSLHALFAIKSGSPIAT